MAIAEGIELNEVSTVKSLHLTHNRLGPAAGFALAKMLTAMARRRNRGSLRTLSLGSNGLGSSLSSLLQV